MPGRTETSHATGSPRYLRDADEGKGDAGMITVSSGRVEPAPGTPVAIATEATVKAAADAAKAAADAASAQAAKATADAAARAEADKLPPGMARMADGKVQVLAPSAYKRLKEESARKAENKLARDLGFDSVVDMRSKVPAMRTAAPAKPPEAEPAADTKASRQDKWQAERDEMGKRLAAGDRRARDAQALAEEREADMALTDMLVAAGVRKVKVGIHMLHDRINGLSEEQIESLSTPAIIEEWRNSEPWLFGETAAPAPTRPEVVVAARTGPAGGSPPPPSGKPAAVRVDCSKMSREEYQSYLAQKGISGM